jgi:hypothetical protein
MSDKTIIIRTDCGHSFAIADDARGRGHRHIFGAGPHTLGTEAWSQPGGPRGTSSPMRLPAGTIITRAGAGDEYTCAAWRAILPAEQD